MFDCASVCYGMENSFSLTPKGKINEILRSIRSDGGVSSGLDWAISQVKRKRKLGPGRSQRQNNYGYAALTTTVQRSTLTTIPIQ